MKQDRTSDIPWDIVWPSVADGLMAHHDAGMGHLLTEESLRWETALALGRVGVGPDRLTTEVVVPELPLKRLDLVVDGAAGAVIELKFPRRSKAGASPETHIFGQLLRDLRRVAAVPARHRWVVQVIDRARRRSIDAAFDRLGVRWGWAPGELIGMPAGAWAGLAPTALRASGASTSDGSGVTACCTTAAPAGNDWTLFAFRVDGPPVQGDGPPVLGADKVVAPKGLGAVPEQAGQSSSRATRDGARKEIVDAARTVAARRGDRAFTVAEVTAEMQRRGTGYATSTISTMIVSHMCVQAGGTGEVVRVDRGTYSLRR